MHELQDRQQNHAAYRRTKAKLDQTYPPGRFLAIAGGEVVADAAGFDELRAALQSQGRDPAQTLIVQAGADYPESVLIFGG